MSDGRDNFDLEAIKAADIIWAVGPDPEWILVYARHDGEPIGLVKANDKIYPNTTKVYCVGCATNEEIESFIALVDKIKRELG